MRRAKEDIVRDIAAVVGPVLERKGFTHKTHRFDAADGFGNKRPRPLARAPSSCRARHEKTGGHRCPPVHCRPGVSRAYCTQVLMVFCTELRNAATPSR